MPLNLLKSTTSRFKANPAFVRLCISGDATVHIDILVWQVGAVDCDLPLNGELCDEFDIQGFPTLKTYATVSGMHHDGDDGKQQQRHSADYEGPRDAKGIVDYLVNFGKNQEAPSEEGDPSAEQDVGMEHVGTQDLEHVGTEEPSAGRGMRGTAP